MREALDYVALVCLGIGGGTIVVTGVVVLLYGYLPDPKGFPAVRWVAATCIVVGLVALALSRLVNLVKGE